MKKCVRLVVAISSALLLLPAAALAQGVSAAAIAGVVRDTSGAVLPGVTVEASSSALIEKVRTVVTDDQGRYQIIDLRPGTYTVTFTLAGFSTLRREGVELTTGFTATVNGDLTVGSVEESVTVTGEAPLVDTRSSVQQTSLQAAVLDALPTTRRMGSYATLLPAATGNSVDVGGLQGERGANFAVHGGRANELNVNMDGMNLSMLVNSGFSYNPSAVQEVVLEAAGTSAESYSAGIRVNIVPREGGNDFSGNFNLSYSSPDLQSANLSDDLIGRRLFATPSMRKSYQVGGAFGGPIKRDKIWFFTAHRKWVASTFVPGTFYNKLNGTLFYEPDRDRPGYTTDYFRDHTLRMTWQASSIDKVVLGFSGQDNCNCPIALAGNTAPEAVGNARYTPSFQVVSSWDRPATSRLLLEAGVSMNGTTLDYAQRPDGTLLSNYSVNDLGLGITYGARAGNVAAGITNPCCYGTMAAVRQYSWRGAVSHITGSHAFKSGMTYQWAALRNHNQSAVDMIHGARQYTFRDGVPQSVTIYATPFGRASDSTTVGIYAQDQWTMQRLTMNLGLRYDAFNATAVAQSFSAGYFVGARDFPEVKNVPVWRNLDPRIGVAYDLFGNGRSAVKASFGRYVIGTSSVGNNNIALDMPVESQANQATRTWNDANRNYVPDCELGPSIPGANGECGPLSDLAFGQLRTTNANRRLLDDVLRGFNDAQPFIWRGSMSFEHQISSGVGVNVGYFRTSYGNFQATDNERVTPADYDPYCITAPSDARLPSSVGGKQICGLYDIKPAAFGQVFNLVTQARNFGERTEVFNGVDVNINARLGGGFRVQGGMATGSTVTDNCIVIDSPQLYQCRNAPSWGSLTQVKFLIIYPMPWDLRASAIFQNLPGLPIQASYVASNAEIAQTLGRNLGSCRGAAVCNGTVTLNLIEPNTVFEPRRTQLDLRLARTFRIGGFELESDLDLYNALNSNDVLEAQTRYGTTWLNALSIVPGRLVRFGLQLNF